MAPVITTYTSVEELETRLCEHIGQQLADAIAARGQAYMVVSGGNSPKGLYRRLRNWPLDWEKVTLVLSDERWVPTDHEDSNEKLIRDELLQGPAENAHLISLKNGASQVEEGMAEIVERLTPLPDCLDVVLLGMGADGHTASLFPCTETLCMAMSPNTRVPCLDVTPLDARWPRITLTLQRLLASREIILLLFGEEKMAILKEAMEDDKVAVMPVRAVLNQSGTPVQVAWTSDTP